MRVGQIWATKHGLPNEMVVIKVVGELITLIPYPLRPRKVVIERSLSKLEIFYAPKRELSKEELESLLLSVDDVFSAGLFIVKGAGGILECDSFQEADRKARGCVQSGEQFAGIYKLVADAHRKTVVTKV